MKFYLIEITTKAETIEKAIYQYDTLNEAIANFHSKMGGAMKNAAYLAEMLQVINESGATQKVEFYDVRPVPEPEPEPEPEG